MIKVPRGRKRGYCCLLSDFLILYTTAATSFLSVYSPHLQRASFCRFHPAASLFISATLTPTSLSVFSLLLFYEWPPPHHWLFHAVPSGLLNTSTYFLTFIYFRVFSHFWVKSCCCCNCSLCNLPIPPPQICQVRLNLTSQVARTDKEHACASEWSSLFIFCVSIGDTEKLMQLWFCCTSLLKAPCNLCLSNSNVQQKAEKTR